MSGEEQPKTEELGPNAIGEAIAIRCRDCFELKKEWEGSDAYANIEGVYIHCRACNSYLARTPPIPIPLDCDLCREGVDHSHESDEFRAQLGVRIKVEDQIDREKKAAGQKKVRRFDG